jgi:glycosyltransferase involved in cell wall biosynthesis
MNSKESPKLSVVFSFRNEEDVLNELIRRTRDILQSELVKKIISSHELIFVNDASTDRSLNILLDESKGHDDIRIVNMSRVFGVSPCVLAGMKYAVGDLIVYMDADLQDPPEVILELLQKWEDGVEVDVVHTVRRKRSGEPKIKLMITRVGYILINKFSRIELPIEAGDFKLLTRKVVNHLLNLNEKNPYLRGLVCWVGFRQEFLKYDRSSRFSGNTKFNIFSTSVINNFFDSALISFSSAPLKLSLVLGVIAMCAGCVALIHVLWIKLQGTFVPGWTAIMVAVIFMGGVQLLCLGIIGLYLNSVFEENKHRPNYIVASTFGINDSIKNVDVV